MTTKNPTHDAAIVLPPIGGDADIDAMRGGAMEIIPPGAILPQHAAIELSQWEVMNQIAQNAVKAGIYPRLTSVPDGIARILAGREMGLGPSASLANLYVVNGRVGMGAALVGALIKRSERYNYVVKTLSDTLAEVEFSERGEPIGTSTFSMADAQKAGVLDRRDSPWNHYPRNMLLARAITNGARWYCPDVFHGSIYTQEELDTRTPSFTSGNAPRSTQGDNDNPLSGGSGAGMMPSATPDGGPSDAAVPLTRTPWAAGAGIDGEPCVVHWTDPQAIAANKGGVVFFRRGKMRSHAHPLSTDKAGGWCNRDGVAATFKRDVTALMQASAMDAGAATAIITATLPDLIDIPPSDWRPADWQAAADVLRELGGKQA